MVDATIRDVARRAEVSVASVSRALNGLANVHPTRGQRVRCGEIARLRAACGGAQPEHGADPCDRRRAARFARRILFRNRPRADREASARGISSSCRTCTQTSNARGRRCARCAGGSTGLVVMAPQISPEELAETLPQSLPVVLINSPEGSGRAAIRIGNHRGAAAMVDHLVERGARTIVHIAGPAGNLDALERREGFEHGIARHRSVTGRVIEGDFTEESGERAVASLLADGMRADAIFAANDMMALGAIQVLRDAGRAMPADIALAGFDDVPFARFLSLTTMRVKMDEIGGRAAGRLIDALEGRPARRRPSWSCPN